MLLWSVLGSVFLSATLLLASPAWSQSVVYEALPGGQNGASQLLETGDSITLAGVDREITSFEINVFSELPSDSFDLQVRFYANDALGGAPGTLLFEAFLDDVPVTSTSSAVSVPVPNVVVPDSFTWTVLTGDSADTVYLEGSDDVVTGAHNSLWFFDGIMWNEVIVATPRAVRVTAVAAGPVEICHRAGNGKGRFKLERIDAPALEAHLAHGDFLPPCAQ